MDIYDISWCPNSQHLVSSGTDSNVIIWDIEGIQYTRIHDHSGYIQGIEWTQDDNTILSVANDRTTRVYSYSRGNTTPFLQVDDLQNMRTPKKEYRISKNIVNNKPCKKFLFIFIVVTCRSTLRKMLFDSLQTESMEVEEQAEITEIAPAGGAEENEESKGKGYYMFLGDTVPTFYRRPSSSSEGLFSVIPCGTIESEGLWIGVYQEKEGSVPRNCSYLYVNGIYEK